MVRAIWIDVEEIRALAVECPGFPIVLEGMLRADLPAVVSRHPHADG